MQSGEKRDFIAQWRKDSILLQNGEKTHLRTETSASSPSVDHWAQT